MKKVHGNEISFRYNAHFGEKFCILYSHLLFTCVVSLSSSAPEDSPSTLKPVRVLEGRPVACAADLFLIPTRHFILFQVKMVLLRRMILLIPLFAALVASGASQRTRFGSGSSQRAPSCGQERRYYPHERNCDMYYQCENGTLREGVCPDGLVFDDKQPADTLRCDLPFDIDCSYRSGLQPPLSTEHCPRLYGLYAHETDCSRFWKCVEGHAFAFYCPEGLAYNEYSAHCDWPDMVENCDSEALLSFRCPQPTDYELQEFGDPRYPFPGDCRKHYVCILTPDGSRQPRLLACDPGLVFNPQTSICDDPENVKGCQGYYNNLTNRRLRELFSG